MRLCCGCHTSWRVKGWLMHWAIDHNWVRLFDLLHG